jgi:hypothetical protein
MIRHGKLTPVEKIAAGSESYCLAGRDRGVDLANLLSQRFPVPYRNPLFPSHLSRSILVLRSERSLHGESGC